MTENKFKSLAEFYPYYLSEHRKPMTRIFHFTGTALLIVCLIYAIWTQKWLWLILVPVLGYGFAWISHAIIERNKPATFTYPFYSLCSDFIMFRDMLTGRITRRMSSAIAQFPSSQK